MSGMVSAGALIALEELGLRNAFDAIYAFSAGAPNAAYFLSGQVRLGASIYYENLIGRQFINFFKPWRIVNVPYLMNIFECTKRLEPVRIMNGETSLFVRLQNIVTREIEYVDACQFSAEADFFSLLRAAVSMPFLTPGATLIQGKRFKEDLFGYHKEFLKSVLAKEPDSDVVILYSRANQRPLGFVSSDLVLELIPPTYCAINPLETRGDVLKRGAEQMGRYVKSLFEQEGDISLKD